MNCQYLTVFWMISLQSALLACAGGLSTRLLLKSFGSRWFTLDVLFFGGPKVPNKKDLPHQLFWPMPKLEFTIFWTRNRGGNTHTINETLDVAPLLINTFVIQKTHRKNLLRQIVQDTSGQSKTSMDRLTRAHSSTVKHHAQSSINPSWNTNDLRICLNLGWFIHDVTYGPHKAVAEVSNHNEPIGKNLEFNWFERFESQWTSHSIVLFWTD